MLSTIHSREFDLVVENIANNNLKSFTKVWRPQTKFSLNQLADTLYPNELARATKARLRCTWFFWLALLIVFSWVFWKNLQPVHGSPIVAVALVALFPSMFCTLLISGVTSSTERFDIVNRWMTRGIAGTYTQELRRFADALLRSRDDLDLTLAQFMEGGFEKIRTLATEHLVALAEQLMCLESEREKISLDAPDSFVKLCASVSKQREHFGKSYNAFESIGLASGGYGHYFRMVTEHAEVEWEKHRPCFRDEV